MQTRTSKQRILRTSGLRSKGSRFSAEFRRAQSHGWASGASRGSGCLVGSTRSLNWSGSKTKLVSCLTPKFSPSLCCLVPRVAAAPTALEDKPWLVPAGGGACGTDSLGMENISTEFIWHYMQTRASKQQILRTFCLRTSRFLFLLEWGIGLCPPGALGAEAA
jgi:hypothetical protein